MEPLVRQSYFRKTSSIIFIADGEITGMRMIDSEGEILTREVKVKFVDGDPMFLEGIYIWKTKPDFDRFVDLLWIMPNQAD